MSGEIAGLIGLFGGALMGLSGWYYGRRKAAKERALDEVHDHIWQKSRSFSWFVTIVAIYFFFTLHLLGIKMSIAMILSMLILVQLGSWAFSGILLSSLIYSGKEINTELVIGISIIIISAIIFTFISIITGVAYCLLGTIPFSIIGYYFIRQNKLAEH